MSDENSADNGGHPAADDIDWENRVLCSDGNCIGVIGPDGRCKECGKPFEGELPGRFQTGPVANEADTPPEASEPAAAQPHTDAPAEEAAEEPPTADSSWDRRVLCSDGNCIGVIGPDGRCKECGKPYQPASTDEEE
jgi:hypothetical protein